MVLRKDEMLCQGSAERLDPHSPALSECLMTAEMLGASPENVLLVGIVGEFDEPGSPMSADVEASVVRAIDAILWELDRLGFEFQKRAHPSAPAIWWSGSPSDSPVTVRE